MIQMTTNEIERGENRFPSAEDFLGYLLGSTYNVRTRLIKCKRCGRMNTRDNRIDFQMKGPKSLESACKKCYPKLLED